MAERAPLSKLIDILAWLADHPDQPPAVRQIARDLSASPSTIHRIFRVLEDRGLFIRDKVGSYSPSLELYRICQNLAVRTSPVGIAKPHLEALSGQCDETILLAVYDSQRRKMMRIFKIDSPHPLRYHPEVDQWIPVHAGASGLAIMAFLPPDERKVIAGDSLTRFTGRTRVTPEALEAAVALAQDQGYLCTRGERTVGAVGIAAPIFDAVGEVFGDVCVTIPEQRFTDGMEAEIALKLKSTCTTISEAFHEVGYRRT